MQFVHHLVHQGLSSPVNARASKSKMTSPSALAAGRSAFPMIQQQLHPASLALSLPNMANYETPDPKSSDRIRIPSPCFLQHHAYPLSSSELWMTVHGESLGFKS
ncbi:hypothetical protein KIL84_015630 [Mauremys mutica]|uniref:Uncharacterized protein n=1 Tax=Mauremys mutica TaxID=74926 RepID=A0A9D3WTP7_9SAUR|nr:hypothetical protein KIL84_015630 [Mauremys mutica]